MALWGGEYERRTATLCGARDGLIAVMRAEDLVPFTSAQPATGVKLLRCLGQHSIMHHLDNVRRTRARRARKGTLPHWSRSLASGAADTAEAVSEGASIGDSECVAMMQAMVVELGFSVAQGSTLAGVAQVRSRARRLKQRRRRSARRPAKDMYRVHDRADHACDGALRPSLLLRGVQRQRAGGISQVPQVQPIVLDGHASVWRVELVPMRPTLDRG